MNIPEGYPIRSVSKNQYYEDMDFMLQRRDLIVGGQHTLRAVTNRLRVSDYARDYVVNVDGVEVASKKVFDPEPEFQVVAFRPVSAEGVVLPIIRRERIMEDGLLYSIMRLMFSIHVETAHIGYFAGTDDTNEYPNIQDPEKIDAPIYPELVRI